MDIIEWLLEKMGRQRRGEGINPLTHAGYEVHNQAYGTPAPRATPSVGGGMSLPVMQRMVSDLSALGPQWNAPFQPALRDYVADRAIEQRPIPSTPPPPSYVYDRAMVQMQKPSPRANYSPYFDSVGTGHTFNTADREQLRNQFGDALPVHQHSNYYNRVMSELPTRGTTPSFAQRLPNQQRMQQRQWAQGRAANTQQDKLAQVRARHQATQELQRFQKEIQQPQKRTGQFNAPRSTQSGHQWY